MASGTTELHKKNEVLKSQVSGTLQAYHIDAVTCPTAVTMSYCCHVSYCSHCVLLLSRVLLQSLCPAVVTVLHAYISLCPTAVTCLTAVTCPTAVTVLLQQLCPTVVTISSCNHYMSYMYYRHYVLLSPCPTVVTTVCPTAVTCPAITCPTAVTVSYCSHLQENSKTTMNKFPTYGQKP